MPSCFGRPALSVRSLTTALCSSCQVFSTWTSRGDSGPNCEHLHSSQHIGDTHSLNGCCLHTEPSSIGFRLQSLLSWKRQGIRSHAAQAQPQRRTWRGEALGKFGFVRSTATQALGCFVLLSPCHIVVGRPGWFCLWFFFGLGGV